MLPLCRMHMAKRDVSALPITLSELYLPWKKKSSMYLLYLEYINHNSLCLK